MCGEEFYLPGANIPQAFKDLDRVNAERHMNDPKIITEPKKIPMPFIQGCKGAKARVYVTEDWYVKHEKKRLTKLAKEKRDMQIEMMQLISQRDRLRFKLGNLDPSSKKDSKKIVVINIKLKDIDAELKVLQEQSGVDLEQLDHGTKFGRYVGHFKRAAHKVKKKIKKFFKRNEELITGILSIAVPAIIFAIVKKIGGAAVAAVA